jgi:hypothetical protein
MINPFFWKKSQMVWRDVSRQDPETFSEGSPDEMWLFVV